MPLDNTWRLLSEFAVDDAAIIIAGGDPSYLEYDRVKALWERHKIENTNRIHKHFGGPFGTPVRKATPTTSYESREPVNEETALLIQFEFDRSEGDP